MTLTPQQRGKASCALAKSMAALYEIAEDRLPPALQVAWNGLEGQVCDFIVGADFDNDSDRLAILEARAPRPLRRLPDEFQKNRSCWPFDENVLARVLSWITPEEMTIAIQKGLVPTRATQMLIDHAPGDPDWDALVVGPFSKAALGSATARDAHDFLSAYSVARVENLDRLYVYARAQARHHPDLLRAYLERLLKYEIDRVGSGTRTPFNLHGALILVAAGVSVSGLEAVIEARIENAYPEASGHERMRILGLGRDLEAAILEARRLKH